jgi:transposase
MSKAKLTTRERRQLRTRLRQARDVHLYRRTLAMLEYDRGEPVSAVAQLLGVSRQSVYNWIARFQQRDGAAGLSDAHRSGRPVRAGETFDVLLRTLLILSPQRFGYHATHWTIRLLRDQLWQNTAEDYSDDTIRRGLHRLGYGWKRPRCVLEPDATPASRTGPSHPLRSTPMAAVGDCIEVSW